MMVRESITTQRVTKDYWTIKWSQYLVFLFLNCLKLLVFARERRRIEPSDIYNRWKPGPMGSTPIRHVTGRYNSRHQGASTSFAAFANCCPPQLVPQNYCLEKVRCLWCYLCGKITIGQKYFCFRLYLVCIK